MIYISGRKYSIKGVYGSWNEAYIKAHQYKRTTHKRWFIKKGEIGYILYCQI